jgi:hypothetical protein
MLFGPSVLEQAREILGGQIERFEAREFALPDGRMVKPKFDADTGEQCSLEFVRPKPPPLPHQRPLKLMDGKKVVKEIPFEHRHYQG